MQNLLKPIRDAIEQKKTTFKPADILPRIVEIDKLIAENLTIVEQTTRDLLAIAKLAAYTPFSGDLFSLRFRHVWLSNSRLMYGINSAVHDRYSSQYCGGDLPTRLMMRG